jgi:hypothetical protein
LTPAAPPHATGQGCLFPGMAGMLGKWLPQREFARGYALTGSMWAAGQARGGRAATLHCHLRSLYANLCSPYERERGKASWQRGPSLCGQATQSVATPVIIKLWGWETCFIFYSASILLWSLVWRFVGVDVSCYCIPRYSSTPTYTIVLQTTVLHDTAVRGHRARRRPRSAHQRSAATSRARPRPRPRLRAPRWSR